MTKMQLNNIFKWEIGDMYYLINKYDKLLTVNIMMIFVDNPNKNDGRALDKQTDSNP